MTTAAKAIGIYEEATEANLEDELRAGSLLVFPNYGQVVMTGDMHGHRRNFEKLQRYCDLAHYGPRHVVIQELIHEEPADLTSGDTSHLLLLEAARWKCAFPDQVHFLQSNHESSQVLGHEITKNGRAVTTDFIRGVHATFGGDAPDVLDAMYAFIRSFPLAGRTANRVFLSHSLPGPRDLPEFDPEVFDRLPIDADLDGGGSAHVMVWGRYHTAAALSTLADLLDVDFMVCGHQPQELGYGVYHDQLVILASDHNHGTFLPIDLGKPVTLETLCGAIRPLAGVM